MKKINHFNQKKVLVLGLAKSGYNAAKLLHELGASVTVNDGKVPEDKRDSQDLEGMGISVITGSHPEDLVSDQLDYMVKNPGIPYENSLVQKALSLGIPVLTDIELAYLVSEADLIAVTGTNGKTTTTMLISEMLKNNPKGGQTYIAGNIGVPATNVAKAAKPEDTIVMEVSSFQLMGIDQFRPKIALITNTYSAHLDYHGSREAYLAAKMALLKNQGPEDSLVLNLDVPESLEIAKKSQAKVFYFSKDKQEADAYVHNGLIYVLGNYVMSLSDVRLPGTHNLENVLAAALVAVLSGQTKENIIHATQNFSGVKHRTQYVATLNNRAFYNDSKATNILATRMALEGFAGSSIVLIAGGLDRGNGFEELEPALKDVHTLVVYGQTKDKLLASGRVAGVANLISVDSLEEAVPAAYAASHEKDVILFSPACASWDQFANFEVRGDVFIDCVEKIKE